MTSQNKKTAAKKSKNQKGKHGQVKKTSAPAKSNVESPTKKVQKNAKNKPVEVMLDFADNSLLPSLYGEHNEHLSRIEQKTHTVLSPRGNYVNIKGEAHACEAASIILGQMYAWLEAGENLSMGEVDGFIRMVDVLDTPEVKGVIPKTSFSDIEIRTRKAIILPRTKNQGLYMDALRHMDMTFGLGPAGTGKTFLAVAMAVSYLLEGRVERIILSRPAVEAGEKLGFLPGDVKEKVDPYLRPLYDALNHMMSAEQAEKRMDNGDIEVAPLAFMRGRTLSNAFVILDEAQNTTVMQMKMFLTRFGENCHMAICGDPSQVDLPDGSPSGLNDAVKTLENIDDIAFIKFTGDDVVRHQLVGKIVKAYDAKEAHKSGRDFS